MAFTGTKCSRAQYLRCVRLRQKVCPTFADVALDTDRVFKELLPDGVPNAVTNCKCDLADVSEVRCRFDGPAALVFSYRAKQLMTPSPKRLRTPMLMMDRRRKKAGAYKKLLWQQIR